MKFTSKETRVTSNQKAMQIELGLNDQKKAIELLYSQYSNPIQTCVQELVSNAFDAMQDAGKQDSPIKVQLPTALNDYYFSVRDYGNSMDDDTIKNVYMKVNASTKSNSNKAIGGFGIGSKTPWAYTDTFILKTFLNGLETQYALVKGRSSVAVVYQGETNQENGTEVIFKTKERDEKEFKRAVRRISLCAKIKPIVNSDMSLNFESHQKVSPNISLVRDDLVVNDVNLDIGGVLYEMPWSYFQNENKPWSVITKISELKDMFKSALIIHVPVGALMPLQTREGLFTGGDEGQHNKVVSKKLVKYAIKKVEQFMLDEINNAKTVKQAVDVYKHDLLKIRHTFKFDKVEINQYGININIRHNTDKQKIIDGKITTLTRSGSGWRSRRIKTLKRRASSRIEFKELEHDYFFFSELPALKSKLNKRFYDHAGISDVHVLEQDKFENKELYELLKELTEAENIETVDLPITVNANKGKKRDTTKVLIYTSASRHRGHYRIGKDKQIKKTIVVERDGSLKYHSDIYRLLDLEVWFVAKTNVKKLIQSDPEIFLTEEQAVDYDKLRDYLVESKVAVCYNKLDKENTDYVMKLATESKRKLLLNVYKRIDLWSWRNRDLINDLYERYGSAIDRQVKTMVKKKVRVNAIVDKAPLVQHIGSPSRLRGEAKKHLDAYIVTSLGV